MPSPAVIPRIEKSAGLTDDVVRAQAGDLQAFERLYRQHVGRVTALCTRLTTDVSSSEELMQDVFVRAWERLQSFHGESSLESWLHRVTVNVFLADNRRVKRRRVHEDTVDQFESLPAQVHAADPADRLDLERAIALLPESARVVFVLHDIEGYAHDEIAAMSGIAPATVRVQLHRARRHMMEALTR